MASKRRYPITECANRDCQTRVYTPHDKRQRFCCVQCRFNYNNDRRSKQEKNTKSWLTELERCDKKLEICYLHLKYKEKSIEDWFLKMMKFDLSNASLEKSQKTDKQVYWFKRYGLQPVNKKETLFKILCRNHI